MISFIAKFFQFQTEVQQVFNCRRFDYSACLEEDYNIVVKKLATEKLLLNFGFELTLFQPSFNTSIRLM